jgi:LacI family transcriptional regulator
VAHTYRIREIAAQSGFSPATVDRVLHGRAGVRASTVREVHQAIDDLDRQRTQLRVGRHTVMLDVVVQAPQRFCAAVRAAMEAELTALRPAILRTRFHLVRSNASAVLERINNKTAQGVILKAPDEPAVVAAVDNLEVPAVTLVTDLPASRRIAYVGIDNRAAGATAAYLIEQWLGDRPGDVLVVRGHGSYRGEDEREAGFRAHVGGRGIVEVVDDEHRADAVHAATRSVLSAHPDVRAVYSLYAGAGGNGAVVAAFAESGRAYTAFVAHDLDGENTPLLRTRKLSAVLHHDLRQDLRNACHAILQARGILPGPIRSNPSAIQIITPFNAPPVHFGP